MLDTIIIGAGPAGMAAGIYAARAELSHVVLESGLMSGGQIINTSEVDNYPGLKGIGGFELGQQMQQQAERFGAETVLTEVLELDLSPAEKAVRTSDGMFWGKTVVFATGASPAENPDNEAALQKNFTTEQWGRIKAFYLPGGLNYEQMGAVNKAMMAAFRVMVKKQEGESSQMYQMLCKSYDLAEEKYIQPLVEHCQGK